MGSGFYGWYFRCQSREHTAAFIPAIHKGKKESTCSIQVITDHGSWNVSYPCTAYERKGAFIRIGESQFSGEKMHLHIDSPELCACGDIFFGALSPVRYDIMGPFRCVPFLECRHSVFSMKHTVEGKVEINGIAYVFTNGTGYWEGDRGRSFPKEYIWTQSFFPEGSLMLSVADIPIGRCRFTGIIGVVFYRGKEYRLATYLGAKAERIREGEILIRQGNKHLTVKLLEESAQPLHAPVGGVMERMIHEHPSCKAFYHFQENGHTIFAFEAENAAFEYEYPRK